MKKLLATLLASSMALTAMGGLVACGDDKPVLKVWAPSESISAYEKLRDEFLEAHTEYKKYKIAFEPVEETVVQTSMGKDPSTGAAVFFFPSDHLYKLNKAGVLQALTTEYTDIVKARDEEFTYEFATINNELLAFPATNDNGYFLYYDSRVEGIEEAIGSLDDLQALAKGLGKHIAFNYGDVFNAASFYIGTGCEFGYGDYTMQTYHTTLNSDAGKAATKAYLKYFDPALNNGYSAKDKVITNSTLADGLAGGTYIAGVDGTWKWSTIKEKMEAKEKGSSQYIKTAVLPSFTVPGDDTTYYMGSFYGAKYCGVNRMKSKEMIRASLALAEYFTSKEGQIARYHATFSGPSNKEAAQDPEISQDTRMITYKAQVERCGRLHRDQSGDFWSPSGFGNLMNKIATGKIKDDDHPNETEQDAAFRMLKDLADSMEKTAK